jgi:phage terminase small subunit
MGRRGPAPTPPALQIARGNPGHRPINLNAPVFAAVNAACPPELEGRAAEEWDQLAADLITKGLLTAASRATFVMYCHVTGEIDAWRRRIARTALRDPLRLPWETHLNKLRTQHRQLGAEFGLTPARLGGVKAVQSPEAADEKRRRFFGAGTGRPAS